MAAMGSTGKQAPAAGRGTLNEYLAEKKAVLPGDLKAFPPVRFNALSTVKGRTGIRDISIRHHKIINDTDATFAGYDLGPNSPELFVAGVSSCIAHTFLIWAALLGVPLDSLDVEATAELDYRGGTPGFESIEQGLGKLRYVARVESSASEQVIRELQAQVERACPILLAVREPRKVTSEFIYTRVSPEDSAPEKGTLNQYLAEKKSVVPTDLTQVGPLSFSATSTVLGRSGIRHIALRHHRLVNDTLPSFAGYDLGASSPEIFLGAFGSCIAHTVLIWAALLEIPLEGVTVDATAGIDFKAGSPAHESTPQGVHDFGLKVHIATSTTKDQVDAIVEKVLANCPILHAIRQPRAFHSELVYTHTL